MFGYDELSAIEYLQKLNVPYMKTGSREICDPPVMDTDVDFVVLDLKRINFESEGFESTNSSEGYDNTDFYTYRQGEVNLIVVTTWEQFRAWMAATAAAKQMNIKDKSKRIALFQGVLYGNW